MNETLVDLLIERKKREKKYFQNYLVWAKRIKQEATTLLGQVELFVFGSIIKGEAKPGSDIDLLIISPKLETPEQKSAARAKIQEKIGSPNPFELHLVTPQEYQNWYQNFIQEKIEV